MKSNQVIGILTSFGRDGNATYDTTDLYLSVNQELFRLPRKVRGKVGSQIQARVKRYSKKITAIHNPFADRPIHLSGLAYDVHYLDK